MEYFEVRIFCGQVGRGALQMTTMKLSVLIGAKNFEIYVVSARTIFCNFVRTSFMSKTFIHE